jgi:membrane protease YdiL (CAAX protease family)
MAEETAYPDYSSASSGEETPQPLPETPPPPLPVSRLRWWIHLILISSYLLAVGALGWNRSASHKPALSNEPGRLLLVCAVELAAFGLIFGLAWYASRASRDDLLLRWRGKATPILLGIGYSVALRIAVIMLAVGAIAVLVLTNVISPNAIKNFATDVDAVVDVAAMRNNPVYFWLVLTVVSFVVAGLREELWRSAFLAGTKALWPKHFGSRAGQVAAVAIASVLFGVGHLAIGPAAVIFAMLLGFGLGLIMVWHRSIWPAVFAHGMFDAMSMALIPWAAETLKPVAFFFK